jgi:pentatricopeptide repeat protein
MANQALSACARLGEHERALALLADMKRDANKRPPPPASSRPVPTPAAAAQTNAAAQTTATAAREPPLLPAPNCVSYSVCIKACGTAARPGDEAIAVLDEAPS